MHRQDIRNLSALCVDYGVKYAVIAPGSRNAPLILAFTSQEGIQCLSVTDERSAAFFALGIAQYKAEPVALICTSGSAVLNFAPAIVEAYYQNLPLIVITADRPEEWIDQSDGQTIRQNNIYQHYIKASFNLPSDKKSEKTDFSDRLVSQALDTALQFPAGPVHLNVPLEEPLYTAIPPFSSASKLISTAKAEMLHVNTDIFKQTWNKSSKKMIVLGLNRPNKEFNSLLETLSNRSDLIVIADNLSNAQSDNFIECPDLFFATLTDSQLSDFQPDLLITVGQSVISKRLKQLLRNGNVNAHWQLEADLPYADTYHKLTDIIPGTASAFLKDFVNSEEVHSDYADKCKSHNFKCRPALENYVQGIPFSDMKVMKTVLDSIPLNYVVQLSNSTPVRLSQLFANRQDLTYFCNRGTSGIEGSVSTAVGSAFRSGKDTVYITGDLSFIYDSNGFWNNYKSSNLKVVLLNNQGANIFSIIGNNEITASCREFFNVPHKVDIQSLCKAYDVKHLKANDEKELKSALPDLFAEKDKAVVLEVCTNSELNTHTFKNLFKSIKIEENERVERN